MAPAAKLATKGSAVCYATTDPELVRSCRTAFAASEDGASRGRELTLSLWGSVRHGGGRRTRSNKQTSAGNRKREECVCGGRRSCAEREPRRDPEASRNLAKKYVIALWLLRAPERTRDVSRVTAHGACRQVRVGDRRTTLVARYSCHGLHLVLAGIPRGGGVSL